MAIKAKILALLILSLLVLGIIIGGTGSHVLYQQSVAGIERTMNNQAVQLATQVTGLFSSYDKGGQVYGQDSDLMSGSAPIIQARLNQYHSVAWGIDRLNFLDTTGKRIALAPYNDKAIGDSLADRTFFKETMNDKSSHISDVIVNRVTGTASVIVTQPVKRANGELAGMVLQAVDLNTIQHFLAEIKIGVDGVIAVVDADGSIIAHTDQAIVKEAKKIPPELMQYLKDHPGQLEPYTDLAGRESIALAVPVKNTNWYAIASMPTSEFKSGFNTSFFMMAAALVAGLIIVSLFAWWYLNRTFQPLRQLTAEANKIAQGDLTLTSLAISTTDEIGQLARSFESMSHNLRTLISQVADTTEQVAASAEELHASADQSAQAATQVATAITETANSNENQLQKMADMLIKMEGIAQKSEEGASAAKLAAGRNSTAVEATQEGNTAVTEAIKQMNEIQHTVEDSAAIVTELGQRSAEIGAIIEVIAGISGQTNLLALNAAIEAARAGEHGKGFAVVAEEVRKLAEQSQQAAKEIANLIGEIQEKTNRAVAAMSAGTAEVSKGAALADKAGQAFKAIEDHVKEVAAITETIAANLIGAVAVSRTVYGETEALAALSREVAVQSQSILAATEEQTAANEGIAASSRSLAGMAAELQEAVMKFKTR